MKTHDHKDGYKLADKIYDEIKEFDMDTCNISKSLGYKAYNLKNDDVTFIKHEFAERYYEFKHS